MPRKALICAAVFLLITGLHAAWISTRPALGASACGPAGGDTSPAASVYSGTWAPPVASGPENVQPPRKGLSGYLEEQDYFLGLSYALSGAFTVYALWVFLERKRAAAMAGAAGGVTLAGLVGGCGLCFVTGCCGSPTLPILASFLGGAVLSSIKPLAFGVAVISIAFGFWWLEREGRRAAAPCGCGDGGCDPPTRKASGG